MTQREYEYITEYYEKPFLQYCQEQATWLSMVNNQKVYLMCDAVQMKALVLTYSGRVLGRYEY